MLIKTKINALRELIKTHLLTFKDDSGDYSSPTEIIPINNCCTVKSADDELNIKNSFVSPYFLFTHAIFKTNLESLSLG
jgi:hypothetical protein